MAQITIPYGLAIERHPVQVKQIIERLDKSNSKEKGSPPGELTWRYSLEEKTINDHGAEWQHWFNEKSLEQQINIQTAHSSVHLWGGKGRWRMFAALPIWQGGSVKFNAQIIGKCPTEVKDLITKIRTEAQIAKIKISNLENRKLEILENSKLEIMANVPPLGAGAVKISSEEEKNLKNYFKEAYKKEKYKDWFDIVDIVCEPKENHCGDANYPEPVFTFGSFQASKKAK